MHLQRIILSVSLAALVVCCSARAGVEAEKRLKDASPKEREAAARSLGQEGNPANVAILATAIQDKDEKVRMAVVKSLIRLGSEASIAPLAKAVQDGVPEIRALAIDGLVNVYLPGFVDTGFGGFFRGIGGRVEGFFSDVDTLVVAQDVKPDPAAVRALINSMNGAPDTATRVRATRAIGILRARDALPDLLQTAFSNNTDLIAATLIAFEKIGDIALGPRVSFLLNYPQKDIQKKAASALGILRTESAIPDLVRLFQNSADDKEVRSAALEALAYMPKSDTTPLFLKYLNDKEKNLRVSSALGLGRLKDPDQRQLLERTFASEKDASVRLALAFALVKSGKMEPLQELVATLDSRIHSGEARPYLTELAREAPVRAALRSSLNAKSDDIRSNLCIVFGASGDIASIPDLEALLKDRKADVVEEATRAIRLIRARGI